MIVARRGGGAVHPYAHMHGHESDVDDSSEEEEEKPVKKRKDRLAHGNGGVMAGL